MRASLLKRQEYEIFLDTLRTEFFEYFDESYLTKAFSIFYEIDEKKFSITKKAKRDSVIEVNLGERLEALYKKLLIDISDALSALEQDEEKASEAVSMSFRIVNRVLFSASREAELSFLFSFPLFIPASRGFFPAFQDKIFTILSTRPDKPGWIDPVLKDFGELYEWSRDQYQDPIIRYDTDRQFFSKLKEIRRTILVGDYVREGDREYIKSIMKGRFRTQIHHASSGQQEAFPMLCALSVWPNAARRGSICVVEEPEAHLFPDSQEQIISLIALISNFYEHKFVITTHSPYILTAFNNLILAGDVKSSGKDISHIMDDNLAIKFEDVSGYSVGYDSISDITEPEVRLIGQNVIDNVSKSFARTFEQLLDLNEDN